MEKDSEVFVGLDVAKARHAVAVAEDGRQGEVRYIGEIGAPNPTRAHHGGHLLHHARGHDLILPQAEQTWHLQHNCTLWGNILCAPRLRSHFTGASRPAPSTMRPVGYGLCRSMRSLIGAGFRALQIRPSGHTTSIAR